MNYLYVISHNFYLNHLFKQMISFLEIIKKNNSYKFIYKLNYAAIFTSSFLGTRILSSNLGPYNSFPHISTLAS